TTGELDDEGDDGRGDHGEPGDCRRVDVDLAEPLVAPVAAQAADRLAASAEEDDRTEAGDDRERDEPSLRVAANPLRSEADAAESNREQRQEPLRSSDPHRTSPRQS